MRAADPLPPTMWRIYLRYLVKWLLVVFVGVPLMAFLLAVL